MKKIITTVIPLVMFNLFTVPCLALEANAGYTVKKTNNASLTPEKKLENFLNRGWYCGCHGDCYSGATYSATGYGGNIGAAISDCDSKLRNVCATNDDGLQTYEGESCSETFAKRKK